MFTGAIQPVKNGPECHRGTPTCRPPSRRSTPGKFKPRHPSLRSREETSWISSTPDAAVRPDVDVPILVVVLHQEQTGVCKIDSVDRRPYQVRNDRGSNRCPRPSRARRRRRMRLCRRVVWRETRTRRLLSRKSSGSTEKSRGRVRRSPAPVVGGARSSARRSLSAVPEFHTPRRSRPQILENVQAVAFVRLTQDVRDGCGVPRTDGFDPRIAACACWWPTSSRRHGMRSRSRAETRR
jgi:hypothetical protein